MGETDYKEISKTYNMSNDVSAMEKNKAERR